MGEGERMLKMKDLMNELAREIDGLRTRGRRTPEKQRFAQTSRAHSDVNKENKMKAAKAAVQVKVPVKTAKKER